MLRIASVATTVLAADRFTNTPAGETAKVVTEDFEMGAGLATVMPFPTSISLIAACGDTRTYLVTTQSYTVDQLLAVARAYAVGLLDEAQRLVDEIRGPEQRKR